jgi:hypothetical protein
MHQTIAYIVVVAADDKGLPQNSPTLLPSHLHRQALCEEKLSQPNGPAT